MASEPLFSRRNPWFVISVSLTAALVLLVAALGMILLPYAQKDIKFAGIWDAICSAAGVPTARSASAPIEPGFKTSDVVLTSGMLSHPPAESIGRGATIALQCAICHGPSGVSQAQSPNLAGQYASVVFKQLQDFKSGARVNAVMTPFAVKLSDQDMKDVAAYYAYLPRLPGYHPASDQPQPRIVINGAPLRGIAPCGSCHGRIDNKTGSPWLEGQSAVYIRTQLEMFARGDRRNDISQQMRNVARAMTPEEIQQAADYYASQSPTGIHTTMR
ncbi:Cytochrome c553 [Faunimonas pinastri]|uniref:Cytochrome c553 n=1 Tax=Faunimonas pinastri TaxID=1855383 RepID=A0A1H9IHM9_9HYPH|nr:c-type cytochrome [Faunimonas pinastri]SEQ74076.1 Cytochrome c553 [Faunimonas pinastri]